MTVELRVGLPVPLAGHVLRSATAADVPAVVALLADDPISAGRGDRARAEDAAAYRRAFEAIDADPANVLLVLDHPDAGIVATMQLTLIPGMARAGASRRQVEAVLVRALARAARSMGARRLVGEYRASDRNGQVADLYPRLGFTPAAPGPDGPRWIWDLDGGDPAAPDWFDIDEGELATA